MTRIEQIRERLEDSGVLHLPVDRRNVAPGRMVRAWSSPPEAVSRMYAHAPADLAYLLSRLAAAEGVVASLKEMADDYKSLADSGDAGFWKAEEQPKYQRARAALARWEQGT